MKPTAAPAPPVTTPARALPSWRIAGALLVAHALLAFALLAFGKALNGPQVRGFEFGSAVIDVIVGSLLVRGVVRVRQLARVRVIVGAVVGAAIHVMNGHWVAAVVLALMSASYLALLATQPRVARALLGGAALTAVLALAGAQLVTDRGGPDAVAALVAPVSKAFVHPTPAPVRGVRGRYRLPVPRGWYLLVPDPAGAGVNNAEHALQNPFTKATIEVSVELIRPNDLVFPSGRLTLQLEQVRHDERDFHLVRRGELPGRPGVAFAEFECTAAHPAPGAPAPREIFEVAVFVSGPQVITLIGHVTAPARASTRRSIVDAMRGLVVEPYEGLPRNEGVQGRPIVEALPPGPYAFDAAPYTITPAPGWSRMNPQLPLTDDTRNLRWLIAPYTAARIAIDRIVAPASEAFEPARYVAAVRGGLTPLPGTMRPEETLRAAAGVGTLFTYDSITLGHRYRNLLWVYVTPSVAYAVQGMVPVERPAQHEAAVRAMIQSFTLVAP